MAAWSSGLAWEETGARRPEAPTLCAGEAGSRSRTTMTDATANTPVKALMVFFKTPASSARLNRVRSPERYRIHGVVKSRGFPMETPRLGSYASTDIGERSLSLRHGCDGAHLRHFLHVTLPDGPVILARRRVDPECEIPCARECSSVARSHRTTLRTTSPPDKP